MKPEKKDIQKWIDALRSEKYKQSQYRLQGEHGYCCLGVACEVFIPKNAQIRERGFLYGSWPGSQPKSPSWLRFIADEAPEFCHIYGFGACHLAALNDEHGFTFNEIADVLQAVYIEEVLD